MNRDDMLKHFPKGLDPRPEQLEIIDRLVPALNRNVQNFIINAPTGVGKSAIAIMLANFFGSSWIVTGNKGLQSQYQADYDVRELKGADAYACYKAKNRTCTWGVTNKYCEACTYKEAVKLAISEQFNTPTVGNIHSYIFHTKDFSRRRAFIADEAHSYPDTMFDILSFDYKPLQVKHLANLKIPLESPLREIKRIVDELKKPLSPRDIGGFNVHEATRLVFAASIWAMYGIMLKHATLPDGGIKLFPSSVKSCLSLMSGFGQYKFLMSATICNPDELALAFGMPPNTEVIEVGTSFPVENRQFVYLPAIGVSSRNDDSIKRMAKYVLYIMEKFPWARGCIHVPSYAFGERIKECLTNSQAQRLVFGRGKRMEALLAQHAKTHNSVLMSPAIYHGVDLKDDLSRFQIVCKVPYADLGNAVVLWRKKIRENWYSEHALLKIVQAHGRATRSFEDMSITFCFDRNLSRILRNNTPPKSFIECLKRTRTEEEVDALAHSFGQRLK